MIKQVKGLILTLSICMMCNAAYAAQSDLDVSHVTALREAYKHILAKEFDLAKESYREIRTMDGVEPGLKRAAVEGEGLALLLDLNARVLEAKGNKVKLRLLRFQRRTTVGYLEKALKKQPDETLEYMLALAKEESQVSDKTFEGLRFSEEYKRLLTTTKATPVKPPEEKKITVSIAPETKSIGVDDTKIPGAKTVAIDSIKYRAKGTVNVRDGPGTNYASIAMLTDNQEVTVIKSIRLSNGQQWLKIKKGERIGYASANFVIKVTKTTSPPENKTGAKTVKAPPPKTVQKPVEKPPQKQIKTTSANNKTCGSGSATVYLTKAKVPVFAAPGGSVLFSYQKNQRINIVNIFPSYLVIRIGPLSGSFKCGYIIKDNASLKRVN